MLKTNLTAELFMFLEERSLISLRGVSKRLNQLSTHKLFEKKDADLAPQNRLIKAALAHKKYNIFPLDSDELWQWLISSALCLNYEAIFNCLLLIAAKNNLQLGVSDEVVDRLMGYEKDRCSVRGFYLKYLAMALSNAQIQMLISKIRTLIKENEKLSRAILKFISPYLDEESIQDLLAIAKDKLRIEEHVVDEKGAYILLKNIRFRLSHSSIRELLFTIGKLNGQQRLKMLTALAPVLKILKENKQIEASLPEVLEREHLKLISFLPVETIKLLLKTNLNRAIAWRLLSLVYPSYKLLKFKNY